MDERFNLFTVLISKISRSIKKIKSEEMGPLTLKSNHVSCLYYIYKLKGLTAKELCDICAEDKASVSRSLEYLEQNGYIFCESTLKKRYRATLLLTEKGGYVGEYISKKIDSVLDKASEGLSDENRKILYESLNIINNNLEQICTNYKGE